MLIADIKAGHIVCLWKGSRGGLCEERAAPYFSFPLHTANANKPLISRTRS